jgi:hypothetical protein
VRSHIIVGAAWLVVLAEGAAQAQTVKRFTVDSAVSINRFFGENAGDDPDIVVDVTATTRIGGGWIAYIRPWFRRPSTAPYTTAKEIYQAAVQYERPGRVATRVDLGYILSPIGLGMMDMRPDTNPLVMPHLSYLIPMPPFEVGAPSASPIASSYPLGGQVTASTQKWDMRAAVLTSPPNRSYVLGSESPNPPSRPVVVVGGGVTPRTGLRLGVAYATGDYTTSEEMTRNASGDRRMNMVSVEGELAFGYTRLVGEVTRDAMTMRAGEAVATQWFLQGVHTLTPRWFVAARHEGANAPPSPFFGPRPTLRISEVAAGFRISRDFTIRGEMLSRKTYYSAATDRQVGTSLVWARKWW